MYITADGNTVFSRLENPGFFCRGPGSHIPDREGNQHCLFFTGIQKSGFRKAGERYGGFLNTSLIDIRGNEIELRNIFSGSLTGVTDADFRGQDAVFFCQRDKLLCEIGIGKTVAEGIKHIFRIGRFIVPEAGFIIAIADIDAFAVLQQMEITDIGIIAAAGIAGRLIFQGESPGIHCLPGGVDVTDQDRCQRGPGIVRISCPYNSINTVVIRYKAELHRIGGAYDQNHMLKFFADIVDQLSTCGAAVHRLKLRKRTVFPVCGFRREYNQRLRGILFCLPQQTAADGAPGFVGFTGEQSADRTEQNIGLF